MGLDKRFWSGAIIVVTVVVAGAGTLPALLLSPAPSQVPPVAVARPAAEASISAPVIDIARPNDAAAASVAATPASPFGESASAPVPNDASPAPAAETERSPAVAVAAPEPAAPQPAPAAPAETAVASVPPETASVSANPSAFPPVQPVDVATRGGAEQAPSAAPGNEHAAPKPARRAQVAAAHEPKRKRRSVRPALYPIREFFAWRR